MPDTDNWLTHYGQSHADISFAGIYWLAVLILVPGVAGLLWSLPVPAEFERISPLLNWGSCFLMAAMVYYFIISMPLAIGMLLPVFAVALLQVWLSESGYSLRSVASVLVALALAGLWLGRRESGGIRAVMGDIQLMMIAPAWLLSVLYKRLGIPY